MGKKDYKIDNVLMCDDIRIEDNNKEILIGVYADEILLSALQTILTRLSFRILFIPYKHKYDGGVFRVKSPSNEILLDKQFSNLEFQVLNKRCVLPITVFSPLFNEEGMYSVYFSVEGGRATKIYEFYVAVK